MQTNWIVVMGVSGCGKSSLGAALAQSLGQPFIEGDAFHSAANVARMHGGQPLTDADRADWLRTLGEQLAGHPQGAVLSCSALKRAYRDQLRTAVPSLRFVHMAITREEAERRVAARPQHMFPASLVANQFDTLEPPTGEPGVYEVDATAPLEESLARVRRWLG